MTRGSAQLPGKAGESETRHAVRAAQYIRMSTEHQKYSTENQSDVIAGYAAQRGMTIVRTYADEGKSGLRIDGRHALLQLIDDITGHQTEFGVILVYDVSRWGRFQDADESAYLEYLCKRAGIAVHYCAEQFENDGSLSATIIKSMKRAMAGEYSRELSTKVFAGQCRLIALGFRQGGPAGFGLRRQLVDESRQPKGELRQGQRKSLQTDRVILVPGPADEVQLVRRIFQMFVEEGRNVREIADLLNSEHRLRDVGCPWTRRTVLQVLTNEKYVGNNVFNRESFKLQQRREKNPPELLVRSMAAFEPIVEPGMFAAAASIIAERNDRFSPDEMLARLAALFAQTGELTAPMIDERDDLPCSAVYRRRFGTLVRAYSLVGYRPPRNFRFLEVNRDLRSLHPSIVAEAIAGIERQGSTVARDAGTDLLTVNGEIRIAVVLVPCTATRAGRQRWKIRFDVALRPDVTLVVRMQPNNKDVLDYYILPRLDFQEPALRIGGENSLRINAYRTDTLVPLFDLTQRIPLRRAA
jgi:DNA invertase Pin-like site-specific DNA recombinase